MLRLVLLFRCAFLTVLLVGVPCARARAVELIGDLPFEITTAQQVALRQLDQLVATESAENVVDLVSQLIDESGGRMVRVQSSEAVYRDFTQFIPLTLFLNDRLLRWGVERPEILAEYRQRRDPSAAALVERARDQQSLELAEQVVDDYLATSWGDEALLLVADLASLRGWHCTALSALTRMDPRWQVAVKGEPGQVVSSVGWERVLARMSDAQFERFIEQYQGLPTPGDAWPLAVYRGADVPQHEVGARIIAAVAAVESTRVAERYAMLVTGSFPGATLDFEGKRQPIENVIDRILEPDLSRPQDHPGTQPDSAEDWPTLGRSGRRVYQAAPLGNLPVAPSWRVEMEAPDFSTLRPPRGMPIGSPSNFTRRLAGDATTWRAEPIVHEGILLAATTDQIYAWQVRSGEAWPTTDQNLRGSLPSLYEHNAKVAQIPASDPLPVDGQFWSSLSASQGRVMARMGPPVAGWLPVAAPRLSQSMIVALDLQRDGRIIDGYPAELDRGLRELLVEFECAPLIIGNRCYVGLNQRDEANITSSVACFDVASGILLFQSMPLGAARPLTLSGKLQLADCFISYDEGLIYYQAGNGVVTAIDCVSGRLKWACAYPRAELEEGGFPRMRRAPMRQASPVALVDGLAIVLAPDCDRVVALDACSGALCWATSPGVGDDMDQVLGSAQGNLLIGGDRLLWLDLHTGQVQASWPPAPARHPEGILANPRRSGRGLMAGDKVYWPTVEQLWVFDATLSSFLPDVAQAAPKEQETQNVREGPMPRSRFGLPKNMQNADSQPEDRGHVARPLRSIDLKSLGLSGGDLIAADGVLVMTSGATVVGFVTN